MDTGSQSTVLPPKSGPRPKLDKPRLDEPGLTPRPPTRTEFSGIKIMARQPDDKPTAKFSSDDSALIRELALLLDDTNLTEIEIERAGLRLRVARNVTVAAAMPAAFHGAAPATAAASGAAADADLS